MIRPVAYEGSEPYIFVSYAHKDSDRVLPIISALQEQGFHVWYDAGIEAGSEWPEYIAEHLEGCTVFLSFLSQAALDSINCRQEINFAIEEHKEQLTVYLEELRLTAVMRMQQSDHSRQTGIHSKAVCGRELDPIPCHLSRSPKSNSSLCQQKTPTGLHLWELLF